MSNVFFTKMTYRTSNYISSLAGLKVHATGKYGQNSNSHSTGFSLKQPLSLLPPQLCENVLLIIMHVKIIGDIT
jgi:hypothetical protein